MKYQCDMIRDLMPLCADGEAAEASRQAVREHIGTCVECARCWSEIQQGIDLDAKVPAPEEKDFVKAAKRYRRKWLLRMLAVFLCGFLATWSAYQIYIGSRYYHGRKTVDGAIREALTGGYGRIFTGDVKYETKLQYDAPDGACSIYFVNQLSPSPTHFLMAVKVTKGEDGLYTAKTNYDICYDIEVPTGHMFLQKVDQDITFASTTVPDADVRSLRLSFPDKEYQVRVGFDQVAYFLCGYAEDYTDATGEALDADGHVLYRLKKTGDQDYRSPHVSWRWEKAE